MERAREYGEGVCFGGCPHIQSTGILRPLRSWPHGSVHLLGLRDGGVGSTFRHMMNKLRRLQWPTPSCGRGASAHGAGLYHPHRGCPGASLSVLHRLPLHRPLASVLTFHHERFCLTSQPCEELGEKTGATTTQILVSGNILFSRVPG